MEENALALNTESGTLVNQDQIDAFDSVITAGDFFPRVQLMTGNSGLVQSGDANVGEYVFIATKDDFQVLGKEIDVLVCSWRLKAMQVADETVISVYNPSDPNFSRIRAQSGVKDSGCMCGVEFLLWIPQIETFATFYMASKSAQREAKKVRSFIDEENNAPGPATLKSTLVETKRYKWHAPIVTQCSTPFHNPTPEKFLKALEKFKNPPKDSGVEIAEAAPSDRER
jgi:hypothetical protein